MLGKFKRVRHYAQNGAQKWLREGLGWAYSSPESWQQRLLLHPLYSFNRFATMTDRATQGQAYISQGISKETGQPMKVAFVGNWVSDGSNLKALFEEMFFQDGTVESENLGVCSGAQFRRIAEQLARQVDLVAVNANELLLWQPQSGEWVSAPSYLRMSFDFRSGETWKEVEKRIGQEYNLRVLRRSGLTYRISHDENDFQRFYHEMYVPLIKQRYGEGGDIMKESDVHNIFKLPGGGVLVIETPEGEAIGGGLENLWSNVLFAILNGVKDGSQELIKKGALSGWYYFSMKRAFDKGCTRFDSGMCQPFLTDGVYIHKHRWGESPSLDYWHPWGMLFWTPNSSPEAVAWMKAHPVHPKFVKYGGQSLQPVYANLNEPRLA